MKTLPVIVAFFCIGFIFGYTVSNNRIKSQNKPENDTITTYVIDSATYTDKVENTKEFTHYDTIYIPMIHDTVSHRDTIYIPVNIPIYDYTFKDSLYFINAEGYNVKMKKIEVYPKTVYRNITRTEYVEKFEREKRFGIGVQAGYGYNVYGKNFSPFIGIGISYNFIRF
jgi:hypothetical protein